MALEQAWQDSHPLVMVGADGLAAGDADGDTCGPDGCTP
jgi:hypothetical protein